MKWSRYRVSLLRIGLELFFTAPLVSLPLWSLGVFAQPAIAQTITEDSSLSSRVTSNGLDFTIHDGTRSGTNLFHSFSEFSVPLGGSATFSNANDVANIISRVTGNNVSDVNGIISANGLANLFLLNPNGIVLGPGAQLNIGGSFIGSTAESITFADGTIFSTQSPTQPNLLTVSAPIGLQLGASSGKISTTGGAHKVDRLANGALIPQSASNLSVQPGRTLALIGNEVSLEGGRISTTGGNIEIGSVMSGQAKLSPAGVGHSFDYAGVSEFADIEISQALVDGINPGGGFIQLQGRDISVTDGAEVYIQNQAPTSSSRGISISASRQFNMGGRSPATNISSAISSESLLGFSGDIELSAQNIEIIGGIGIESIAILAPGGDVTVSATDAILLAPSSETPNNSTGIDTLSFGPAAAGDLTVRADQLTLLEGSTVASLAYSEGDSGNVSVAAQSIEVDGIDRRRFRPSIITSGTFNKGNAGDVYIDTARLAVSAGGRVDSSTAAAGNAGSVTIKASESVSVSGRVANSINPSLIISSANLLDKELRDAFNLPPFPTGDSGDLTINTPLLSVSEGAQVTVRNDGTGKGGTLSVEAGAIQLQDAGITASTRSGGGGNIDLVSTAPILLRKGSILSAEAGGTGNGGNITLAAPFLVALENSDITASAFEGDGGQIKISTQSLLGTAFREQLTPESDITASSQFGVSGVVEISSLEVDPSSGTVALPDNVADYSNQISASCGSAQQNQFVASGRGGLAPNPTRQLDTQSVWIDVRGLSAATQSSTTFTRRSAKAFPNGQAEANRIAPPVQPLIEASSWSADSEGKITLQTDSEIAAIANLAQDSCLANRSV